MNPDIPHPKARGEWAELRFMARAAEHRLCVAKPWGDMAPYDFAVEHNGRFLRVQVKCTRYQRGHSYKCNITSNGTPYARTRLDFIAAYVIPADTWYIIRPRHSPTNSNPPFSSPQAFQVRPLPRGLAPPPRVFFQLPLALPMPQTVACPLLNPNHHVIPNKVSDPTIADGPPLPSTEPPRPA